LHPDVKNETARFAAEPQASWKSPGFEQTDAHPVVCVSWHDAVAFCDWLSKKENVAYRLPSEAEWEFACRAGTKTIYSCGDDPDDVYAHGNVGDAALERAVPGVVSRQRADRLGEKDGDGFAYTAPVGRFKPNALGLYDMHGNVWEWCQDRYQDRFYAARQKELQELRRAGKPVFSIDPQGPETTPQHKYGDWRSVRGGSWYVSPISCRAATRSFAEAGDAFSYTGFRVVRDVK
jgi:sulfatase modifying factor 1